VEEEVILPLTEYTLWLCPCLGPPNISTFSIPGSCSSDTSSSEVKVRLNWSPTLITAGETEAVNFDSWAERQPVRKEKKAMIKRKRFILFCNI
jgi:hypothetical protein